MDEMLQKALRETSLDLNADCAAVYQKALMPVIEALQPNDSKQKYTKFCHRKFKRGDLVYGCRECGVDATCVMCQECYENSNHDGHQVRMHVSHGTGGGCCDCGDVEAWRRDIECSLHAPVASSQAELSAN